MEQTKAKDYQKELKRIEYLGEPKYTISTTILAYLVGGFSLKDLETSWYTIKKMVDEALKLLHEGKINKKHLLELLAVSHLEI